MRAIALLFLASCSSYIPPELATASDLQLEAIARVEARHAAIVADYDRELRAAYDGQLKAAFEAELAKLTSEEGGNLDQAKVAALAEKRETQRVAIAARLDEVRARYSVDQNLTILRRLTESVARWVRTAAEAASNVDTILREGEEIIRGRQP